MTPTGAPSTTPLTRGRMTGRASAMGALTAPGVSVEWVGPLFRGIDALRSDIAGFVGLAARGPVDHPKRLASASEFDSVYGPPLEGMLLAAAVHGFFANGGTTCWVVRAVHRATAAAAEGGLDSDERFRFRARTEGTWGSGMVVDVQPASGGHVTVTLAAPDGRREVWRDLDADGLRDHFGDDSTSTRSASALVSLEFPVDAVLPAIAAHAVLTGGHDGLEALTPAHLTGGTESSQLLHGAALLSDIDEVCQVAVPDLVIREPGNSLGLPPFGPTAIESAQEQFVGDCQALQRTALLQHPDPDALADAVVVWRQGFNSAYAAAYWPWLQIADQAHPGRVLAVPPCGHVAGVVARSDLAAGPHKPPANEPVAGAVGLTRRVDDKDHGQANDAGVNVVRSLPGRGIRVLGARTMSNEMPWRYLNVRRLVTQIERGITANAGWLVFEPDDQSLRDNVERVVRQYLDEIWRNGGLEGRTPDEAYTVHVEDAQRAAAIGDAHLVVEIGLRPPWPAEFVVVRIDVPDLGRSDRVGGGGARGDDR